MFATFHCIAKRASTIRRIHPAGTALLAPSRANPRAGDWVAVDAGDAAIALEQARAAVRQRLVMRNPP
jgi:hypothetical protein